MKKWQKKLAIRRLRRGIGSMDYIDTLMIMEDDLDDDDDEEDMHEFRESSEIETLQTAQFGATTPTESQSSADPTQDTPPPPPHVKRRQNGASVANASQCRKKLRIYAANRKPA